jgi:hypothetical protein
MLRKTTSQISSHQATTDSLRFRPFWYGALCSIHSQPFWTCLSIQVAAWRQNTSCFISTREPYMSIYWPWIFNRATLSPCKNRNTRRTSTFDHVSRRPCVFKLTVPQYDPLTGDSHGCKTTQNNPQMPVTHKICGNMMVFHVRRAVTSSFKLLCKITNYILGVDSSDG